MKRTDQAAMRAARAPAGEAPAWRARSTPDRLRSFAAVVDAGRFARAAGHDPVRASQFQRQVRELEEALGVALLVRGRGGVTPTDAGRRLRAVITAFDAGLAEVRACGVDAPVPVVLAAGESLLQWLVVPGLAGPLAAAPRVRLELLGSSDPVDDVLAGRAHLGLARIADVPPGLTARPVGALAYAVFAPPGLHRPGEPVEALLARAPLVRVTGDPRVFDEAVARCRAPVAPALTCVTFPQAARAVATGRYAAVLPAIAADELGAAAVAVPVRLPGLGAAKLALIARPVVVDGQPALAALFRALCGALGAGLAAAVAPAARAPGRGVSPPRRTSTP